MFLNRALCVFGSGVLATCWLVQIVPGFESIRTPAFLGIFLSFAVGLLFLIFMTDDRRQYYYVLPVTALLTAISYFIGNQPGSIWSISPWITCGMAFVAFVPPVWLAFRAAMPDLFRFMRDRRPKVA